MERYTVEQRVIIVETFYENQRSLITTQRQLRAAFGRDHVPSTKGIQKLIAKFKETGSVQDKKVPVRPRAGRSAENVQRVRDSVAEDARSSIRRRSQQLDIRRSTLQRIVTKDLQLHAYKIQLIQALKPLDHGRRRTFSNWVLENMEGNNAFWKKLSSATRRIFT